MPASFDPNRTHGPIVISRNALHTLPRWKVLLFSMQNNIVSMVGAQAKIFPKHGTKSFLK